jgi:PilZ domain
MSLSPVVESRNTARQRVFKNGAIVFNRAGRIDCVVRNLSSTGASLEVVSPIGIPDSFVLVIRSEKSDVKHPCHVVWRKEHRLGVAFD